MKTFLQRSLKNIVDKSLFLSKLQEEFSNLADLDLLETIEGIIDGAYRGDDTFKKTLLFIGDSHIRDNLIGGRIDYLRKLADEFGYSKCLWVFCDDAKPYSPFEEDNIPFFPELEELSLGHKKYYAKQFDRRLIERLLYDSNPEVIRNLLTNPVITEKDVIKIASRRNINPSILCEIYRNEKWCLREGVRLALINNPHTPVSMRIALVPYLLIQDLKDMVKNSDVHPYVREAVLFAIYCKSG